MIALLAARCSTDKRRASDALDTLLRTLADELAAGDRVHLPHIGALVAAAPIGARKGRNPRTGAVVEIKPYRRIRFRAAKDLKARLAVLPVAAE
jgi:nucleoid DNA-binding protein